MKRPETPMLEKMRGILEESQGIGRFLDWLEWDKKILLAEFRPDPEDDDPPIVPVRRTKEKLLAEYFEIDLDKVEEERVALLEWQRALNEQEAQ